MGRAVAQLTGWLGRPRGGLTPPAVVGGADLERALAFFKTLPQNPARGRDWREAGMMDFQAAQQELPDGAVMEGVERSLERSSAETTEEMKRGLSGTISP